VFEILHLRLISLSGRRRVVRAMNSSNSPAHRLIHCTTIRCPCTPQTMTKMRSRAVSLEVYLSAFLGETEASKKDTVLWLFRASNQIDRCNRTNHGRLKEAFTFTSSVLLTSNSPDSVKNFA
jgi:hypothetical protein